MTVALDGNARSRSTSQKQNQPASPVVPCRCGRIAIGFAAWMLIVEKSPWPTLTLVVSLEAIFLSTFVMIGQNRQGEYAQEQELHVNTELTKQIHQLSTEMHANLLSVGAARAQDADETSSPND